MNITLYMNIENYMSSVQSIADLKDNLQDAGSDKLQTVSKVLQAGTSMALLHHTAYASMLKKGVKKVAKKVEELRKKVDSNDGLKKILPVKIVYSLEIEQKVDQYKQVNLML